MASQISFQTLSESIHQVKWASKQLCNPNTWSNQLLNDFRLRVTSVPKNDFLTITSSQFSIQTTSEFKHFIKSASKRLWNPNVISNQLLNDRNPTTLTSQLLNAFKILIHNQISFHMTSKSKHNQINLYMTSESKHYIKSAFKWAFNDQNPNTQSNKFLNDLKIPNTI